MDLPNLNTNNIAESGSGTKKRESSTEENGSIIAKKNIQLNNNASNNSMMKRRSPEQIKTPPPQQNQRGINSQSPKQQIHHSNSQHQSSSQQLSEKKSLPPRSSAQLEESHHQQIVNAAAVAIQQAISNQRNSIVNQQSQSLQQSPVKQQSNNQGDNIHSVQQSPQHHQGNTYFHNVELQDFEILSKLGEGSFSTVYRVRRGKDGKEYALKRIKMMKLNEKERENAVNEVRFLASIHCRNIISYKQAIYDEGVNQLCVIMEYAEGGDLARIIRHALKAGKHIEEDMIWSYAIQMTIGIKALHDLNILHRDLKAANVFLDKYQTRAMLGDLNVSKKLQSNGLLYTQTGTPYYASPEVWKDKPYNNKSDIWSLGCVIYEMCALKPPFKGKDMEDLFKKVQRGVYDPIPSHYSNELSLFIAQLLRVNPEQRPSCEEILKFSVIRKKMADMSHFFSDSLTPFTSKAQCELISTIRIGKSLRGLKDKLPQPRYDSQNSTQSTANQLTSHSEILQPNQYHRQRKNKYISHASSSNINEMVGQPLGLPSQLQNPSSDHVNKGLYENQGLYNLNSNSISLRQSQQQQVISSMQSSPPSQKSPQINQILLQKQQIKQYQKPQQQNVGPSPAQGKSRCSSVESKQSANKKLVNVHEQYYYNNDVSKYTNLNNSQNSILMGKKVSNHKDNSAPINYPMSKADDPNSINHSIQQLSKEIKMLNSNIYNDEMNNRQKQLHQLQVLQQILDQKIKKKDPKNNSQLYPQMRNELSVKNSQERSISLHKTPQQTQQQLEQNDSRSHSIEPLLVNNKYYGSQIKGNYSRSSVQQQSNQTPVLPRIFNHALHSQNSIHSNTNIKHRDNDNILMKRMKTESTNDSSPTIFQDNIYTIEDKSQSMIYSNNQYLKVNQPQRKSQAIPKK